MCGAPARPKMLVAHIQSVVASYYRIRVNYMWSAQRSRDVARPRQIAMFLSRELTPQSLPEIGRRFGRRDHTTVMYAIARVEQLIEEDHEIALDVAVLRERLTADAETTNAGDLSSRSVEDVMAA
jgi:chromosomal replication initiator protein